MSKKPVPFSQVLAVIISCFFKFMKRVYVFIGFFGIPFVVAFGVSIVLPSLLNLWGAPFLVAKTISKVLLTITPLFPTAVYALAGQEDESESFSPDLCFIAWIATIVYAWWFL